MDFLPFHYHHTFDLSHNLPESRDIAKLQIRGGIDDNFKDNFSSFSTEIYIVICVWVGVVWTFFLILLFLSSISLSLGDGLI